MAILEAIKPSIGDIDTVTDILSNALGVSRVTSRLLINRGILDTEDARAFLNPSLEQLFDPFKLTDMDKAVSRIEKAISSKEHITIYGDYDVDGMTSCALLYNFLTDKGCKVDVYIPNRHKEGYGINCKAIEEIHRRGTHLMVSVDCGITSISQVELAKDLGIDVIITDHHQCSSTLPEAIAVINPARNPELHRMHPLAGVGVAGKLVQAIEGVSYLEPYLDLIALGTVADVVSLVGDNRILVAKGLEKINKSPCPGIEALIEVSASKDSEIDTGRIAFGLAPRLNAAGRIDDPLKGFELLTARKLSHAIPIAKKLEEQNRHRQAIEAEIIREAEDLIRDCVNLSTDRIIVLGKEGWNPGIIGIAASKIAERYCRPCILISIEEKMASGSARSISGFNIYEALNSSSHLLEKFGGHEQAAGFSLVKENIHQLRKVLIDYSSKKISDSMLIPRYTYDTDLKPGDITHNLVNELKAMEPFGIGNPSPTFLLSHAKLEENRKVGSNGKHLKVSVGLGQRLWDGIAFGMGERAETLSAANRVSLVTRLEKNEWRGISKLQLNVKHIDVALQNSQDWEDFLSFFHLKFFDAFFYDFMYNKHNNPEAYSILPGLMKPVSMNDVIEEFKRTGIGNLVLVNSLFNSQRLAQCVLDNNLSKKMISSYGQPNHWDGIGVNMVVFAPISSNIAFSDYRNIYVFEDEISYSFIDFNQIGNAKLHRIISREERTRGNKELKGKYLVQHSDFASLYRWLRSLTPGRSIWQGWQSLVEDYQSKMSQAINGFTIRLMLRIFEELNFIKVQSSYRFVRIQCPANPLHRDLEESSLYRYYKKWVNDIKNKTSLDKFKEEIL